MFFVFLPFSSLSFTVKDNSKAPVLYKVLHHKSEIFLQCFHCYKYIFPDTTPIQANIDFLILRKNGFLKLRLLKERGVYSHNCNKLNKPNMLSAQTSREFKNDGISTPSINTSRDPYRSFKSHQRLNQNPRSGLLCCHRRSILTSNMALTRYSTQTLFKQARN